MRFVFVWGNQLLSERDGVYKNIAVKFAVKRSRTEPSPSKLTGN
jgi:hypothetical protein